MVALARVFFKVRAREVDRLFVGLALLGLDAEGELAALDDRVLELADLIALGQIGIKIVLAVKDRTLGHFGADGKTELGAALNRPAV